MYIPQMLHTIRSRSDTERLEWLDESIKLWVEDAMCGDEKVEVLAGDMWLI